MTLNFTEGTALDSTHLLVCMVRWGGTITTPVSGWTEAPGGGSNTSHVRTFARQGDGSTNGITVTGNNTNKTAFLMAFSGFVSATAADGVGESPTGGPYSIDLSSSPSIYGVVIAGIGYNTVPTSFDSWSNGYQFTGSLPTSGAMWPGRREYYNNADDYTATQGITGTGSAREQIVLYQLTP